MRPPINIRTELKINGIGRLLRIRAPFDGILEAFRFDNIQRPLYCAELAHARITAGHESRVCRGGGFVCEAVIHSARGPTYYIRNSPLLDPEISKKAVIQHNILEAAQETNRCGSGFGEIYFGDILDYSVYESIVTQAEKEKNKPPSERQVLAIEQTKSFWIPADRFSKEEITIWAFQGEKSAEKYGQFMSQISDVETPVWLVDWLKPDENRKPFIRQLFFGGPKNGSSLNGARRVGFDDRVRAGAWGKFPD